MERKVILLVQLHYIRKDNQSHNALSQINHGHPKPPLVPPTQYFIDSNNDGTYEETHLENEPVPNQGKENFQRLFYNLIKYPALARERGIAGLVILQVLVDVEGNVLSVEIQKSLSKECDEAARKAYIQASSQGYVPLIVDAKPVKYKMTIPVQFWLG